MSTVLIATLATTPARAQNATWLGNPGSNDFNTATNWEPTAVPTGTASFGTSSTTRLTFSALETTETTVGGFTFNAGASAYSFTVTGTEPLIFNGAGIANNSSNVQTFMVSNGTMEFEGSSTAGTATITNSGDVNFFNMSTAGNATITNNFLLNFSDTSTAGSATITNNSFIFFNNESTAGNATITTGVGATTFFLNNSTGGDAQLINNGTVDFSGTTGPANNNQITAGSIAGAGTYLLGSNQLTVGSNDLSTIVSGMIEGGGSLVKVGTGTLTLSGANTYTGATTIEAGAINLSGSLVSSLVTVEPSGILAGTGTVSNTVTNAGTIQPGFGLPDTPFAPAALTVGSYVGAGGTLALRTVLGGDNSPTDRLIVNGNVTGTTIPIFITNVGGQGALTTNGIEVVQVGGTSPANAFTLANPELRAGAFDYRLFQGAPDPTASSWFLRSSFVEGSGGPIEPLDPPRPPEPLPPGVWPIIGPELATYGVVQPTARQLGLATLGTLNQRIGDTMTLANAGADNEGWSRSGWARFFGQQVNDHYDAFADPRTNGWLGGFQGGIDLWRGESLPGHRDAAGVYFSYGHANMDVSGLVTNPTATAYVLTHTGTVNVEDFSTGAYWTHYGPSGWYIDAVVQGSVYAPHAATQNAQLDPTGYGFIASLEAGYPIALPFLGPHFILEPQAQIIWQQVGFGSATDAFGQVDLGTTSGPTGRLGVRGQWTIAGENGAVWQPYVGVNFWRDWSAEATTTFSGMDPVPLLEQATRTETFAGVTAKLNSRLSLYAQGGYQFAMEQTSYGITRNGAQGDVGLRYNW